MKKTHVSKLRVLWLTTASSLVLLSGCQTYKNFSRNFINERPAQSVDGERRQPLLNAQRPVPGQALPPGFVPPPQAAAPMQKQVAAPQGAPTPYDMFDESGNEVDAPESVPVPSPAPVVSGNRAAAEPASARVPSGRVITSDDAHFVSNNNMNPPATGADEKSDGSVFGRLFGSRQSEQPGARKPIPGNPQNDMATSLVAPVPQGPVDDNAPVSSVRNDFRPQSAPVALSSVPVSQEPQVLGHLSDDKLVGEVAQEPSKPLLDNAKSSRVSAPVAERAIKAEAEEVQAKAAVRNEIPQPPRVVLEPKGAIPLVAAMPVDPEAYDALSSRAGTPSAAQNVPQPAPVQPAVEAPRSQHVEPMADMHSEVQTEPQSAPVPEAAAAAPRSPEQLPEQAKAAPASSNAEDDMFMPVTDFQTKEEGTVTTVSSLADTQKKAKEEPGFFDRVMGNDSADAKKPNWIERQFSGEDTRTSEQKKPYPGFGAVPEKPAQFGDIQSKTAQHKVEMESALDQAQESKMELNNEPSNPADMTPPQPPADVAEDAPRNVPVAAPVVNAAPAKPEQPQLLGQISAPPPQFDNEAAAPAAPAAANTTVAPVAPVVAAAPVAVTTAPASAKLTPLVAPMGMDGADHQAMTVPPAPSAPVAAPQPLASEIAPAQPAIQVEAPKAKILAQPEPAPAPVAVAPQPAAPAFVPAEAPVQATIEPPAAAVPAAGAQDAPASADNGAVAGSQQLPSPALLDKVRVLPPSRYENRRLPQAN